MPSKNIKKERDGTGSSPHNNQRGKPTADSVGLRTISGVFLIGILLSSLYFGSPYAEILMLVIAAILSKEWCRLVGLNSLIAAVVFGTIIVGAMLACVYSGYWAQISLVIVVLAVTAYFFGISMERQSLRWLAIGLPYIYFPIMSILWVLYSMDAGDVVVISMFALIATNDTCAYFSGKTFQGPKLAPSISPGKTWSGVAGGLIGVCLLGFTVAYYLDLAPLLMAALACCVGVLANLGDLFESGIKRHFGVKDTGTIIPGHGGVLDRLDSVMMTAPIVMLLLWMSSAGVLGAQAQEAIAFLGKIH